MTRATMPAFQERAANLALLYWGGTTATGTLLGQVENFSWTDSINSNTTQRIGDSVEYETFTAKNVTWELSLYEDADIQEVAKLLGTTIPTAGGWLGSESITLSLTQSGVTVTVANYSLETTAGALLWTETLSVVKVKEVSAPKNAGETNMWSFSGRADTLAIAPGAAVGA